MTRIELKQIKLNRIEANQIELNPQNRVAHVSRGDLNEGDTEGAAWRIQIVVSEALTRHVRDGYGTGYGTVRCKYRYR